jgi:nucleotide-binding universal stress UspA family protein
MRRVLVAVDDSPPGLSAARLAVELCAGWRAELRVVTVLADGGLDAALAGPAAHADEVAAARERRGGGLSAVLGHVESQARARGVPVTTATLRGVAASRVLSEARSWRADLVVLGRSGQHSHSATPGLGSQVRHVLEFAEVPVLVVPADRPRPAGTP